MNRKLVSLIAVIVLLTGCTPSPSTPTASAPVPASTSSPAEVKADRQVLRIATSFLHGYPTPQAGTVNSYNIWPIFDTLTQFGPKYEPQPSLAEKWTLSDDWLKWTFTIRKDVTFATGEPLTADDVVFSLDTIIQKTWGQRAYFPNVTEYRATDPQTILITTRVPDASVPNGGQFLNVLPKRYYEAVGDDQFRLKPIGSGPYELVEFVPNDSSRFRLRSTPHAFRKPANTEIYLKLVPEAIQRINGLLTDQFDIIAPGGFSGDQADQLKRAGMQVSGTPDASLNLMMPQGTYESKNTPLANLKVRQALNYAVNRAAIATAAYKAYAIPTGQLMTPPSPAWNDSIPAWPYDAAKAKQLLAEAGYPNGFKITLNWTATSGPQEVPLAVQGDLKQVGVELEIQTLESALMSDVAAGRNNLVKADLFPSAGAEANGMAQFSTLGCGKPVGSGPSANYFCIPEQERINALVLQEPDPAKRALLLQQASKVVADQAPALFILVRNIVIVQSPKVRGLYQPVANHFNFDSVYLIK